MYEIVGNYPLDRLAAYLMRNPHIQLSKKPVIFTRNTFGILFGQIDINTGQPFPGGFYRQQDNQGIADMFCTSNSLNNFRRYIGSNYAFVAEIENKMFSGFVHEQHTKEVGNEFEGKFQGGYRSGFGVWTNHQDGTIKQGLWQGDKFEDGMRYK